MHRLITPRFIAALSLTLLLFVFPFAGCGGGESSSNFTMQEELVITRLRAIAAAQETFKSHGMNSYKYGTLQELESATLVLWPDPSIYEENDYTYTDLLAPPTSTDWGVATAPMAGTNSGNRAYAVTMDNLVRATAPGVILAPADINSAQTLKVVR